MTHKSTHNSLNYLLETMQALRAPRGCPWDAEQTPESLAPYILEEACELIDAIEDGDPELILDELGETFSKAQYMQIAESLHSNYDQKSQNTLADIVDTNYDVTAHPDTPLSERVIFPMAKQESNGMEDVRFVEFIENGKSTYIGTYTAYDGHRITPQLIITDDFLRFKIRTIVVVSTVMPPSTAAMTTSNRPIDAYCSSEGSWCKCPNWPTHRPATSKMNIEFPSCSTPPS